MKEQKYWVVVDYPQIKTSEYLDEMRKLKGDDMVYSYYSNDELDKLCPPPKEVEYMKFEASIEPDKQHLNKSYNGFSKENKNFGTARQILLLNLEVFKITGEDLDIVGITKTSTIDRDGDAMDMFRRNDGGFYIDRDDRDDRGTDYGPREQFTLFPSLTPNPETIEIGGIKYNKEQVENALKDLKAT